MFKAVIPTNWLQRLQALPSEKSEDSTHYFDANVAAIKATLAGVGPDDSDSDKGASLPSSGTGACMVVNIASAHVPEFCDASRKNDPKPYKNGYDLGRYQVGSPPPVAARKLREIVDDALPKPPKTTGSDIYFGAMELNGTGVYFYGDVCLVLKSVPGDTFLLSSNSYDLVRSPLINTIEDGYSSKFWPARRTEEARRMAGTWSTDRHAIAAIKVFVTLGIRPRRLTTGQISDALRVDEDYIEVLKINSFGARDLVEARVTAADSACEATIEDRRRAGLTPPLEAVMWRDRRKVAERELRTLNVPVRIVTTSGRVKA
jgi:hypothetical protein